MKSNLLSILALIISLSVFGQDKTLNKIYVGTFTSEGAEGIYLCNFNTETGDLILDKTFKGVDNPSFLKISKDKKYLYAVSRTSEKVEKSGGYIVAYKIEKNGNISFINKQISNGSGPCHVDVSNDGNFAAIATYGGGTTSLYKINKDGSLQPASSVIINKGSSINTSRQTIPHAHSIKFSPYRDLVYSADLGTDQLNIYKLEKDELLSVDQKFVKMELGAGPRHFEFYPGGEAIYVINELNSTISVLKKDDLNWKVNQNISTLPADFEGESYCADIHISKDGRFLYGSNRGHNSIAIFEVDENSQKLKISGIVGVEGNWPRNFSLSPDGKWMLVANQKSSDITVFKINQKTGIPEFTGKKTKVPRPVCLEFL